MGKREWDGDNDGDVESDMEVRNPEKAKPRGSSGSASEIATVSP